MTLSPKYKQFLAAGMIAVVANVAFQSPAFKDHIETTAQQIEQVQTQKEEAKKSEEIEAWAKLMPKTMTHEQAVERVKQFQAKQAERDFYMNNVTRSAPR